MRVTGTTLAADGSHTLSVDEGSTNTYSVALGSEPGSSVTVTPAFPSGTDVRVNPDSLTFNSGNWNTTRSFTATAREDDDVADDTVKIGHSASSADSDYDGRTVPSVSVTVDDDSFGVTLAGTTARTGVTRLR